MEKIVADAMRPFLQMQLQMDMMEERINKKIDAMSIPDFGRLIEEVRRLQEDVDRIQQQPQ